MDPNTSDNSYIDLLSLGTNVHRKLLKKVDYETFRRLEETCSSIRNRCDKIVPLLTATNIAIEGIMKDWSVFGEDRHLLHILRFDDKPPCCITVESLTLPRLGMILNIIERVKRQRITAAELVIDGSFDGSFDESILQLIQTLGVVRVTFAIFADSRLCQSNIWQHVKHVSFGDNHFSDDDLLLMKARSFSLVCWQLSASRINRLLIEWKEGLYEIESIELKHAPNHIYPNFYKSYSSIVRRLDASVVWHHLREIEMAGVSNIIPGREALSYRILREERKICIYSIIRSHDVYNPLIVVITPKKIEMKTGITELQAIDTYLQ